MLSRISIMLNTLIKEASNICYNHRWWYRQTGHESYTTLPREQENELTRPNSTAGGWYKCEATNHGGTGWALIHVNALCKTVSYS